MKRILYIQYTNPAGYPPLQHSSRILADAGWNVWFLGTGAAGTNRLEFPPHRNIAVRRMAFCEAGWRQKLHFLKYCAWVLWTTLVQHPKWVYASDSLSCPVAMLLTFIPGVRVLYHEHDSPQTSNSAQAFNAFIEFTRRLVARRASICVLPNGQRLERFQSELGPVKAAACVWNCPARNEILREPRREPSEQIWALYHGSIVPDRLPLAVLDALTLLPDFVNLRIVGYETAGSRDYVAKLRTRAEELRIQGRVQFLNTIPQRSDLLDITLKSDIGLALMPMAPVDWNCETMTGASNKAFDYMACGLPVITSDLPDWREMFVDSGYGFACNPSDPKSIASAIDKLAGDPGQMRAMGELSRRKILLDWNYESAFRQVFEHLSNQEMTGGARMLRRFFGRNRQSSLPAQ